MRSAEVLVVGGGAAGMVAAIEAARAGKRVLVLEKKKSLGKKLLVTGNGRCNYTNRIQKNACYRGEDPDAAFQAIEEISHSTTVEWFLEIGILPAERPGYIYPASFQASSVLHALERELKLLKVEIHTEEIVQSVSERQHGNDEQGFLVESDRDSYLAKKLLICTGGKAAPVHGSSGDGFLFAKALGHSVVPPLPALTSLFLEGNFMKGWAGNRLQGSVRLLDAKGMCIAQDRGEIQLVDYGISGIPVFQISRFAAKALSEKKTVFLELDSMPEIPADDVFTELSRRKERAERMKSEENYSAADLLEGMLPDKFSRTILKQSAVSPKDSVRALDEKKLHGIAERIKYLKVQIKAVSGFEKAQVCAGGVPLNEIDIKTFGSKVKRNLFFAGEVLDVDGCCGGYNLQWAWTSGILAGRAIGSREESRDDTY
ncbi:MAG: aminoacetone oxidase family FAD-binding enzyme [Lachnospiraceae bacterium]|nr:aminoacetone oxidase family FAD-binding enzyme [Lachnospiraceae bacterium]